MADLIGQPIDRVDGRLKVMGRATYAYEHEVPNAAYAVMVMSTIAKGRITSDRYAGRGTLVRACCW